MQKQHCTELKLTMKTTTLRNSFLWKLVYSLHSKPQWVTLLLKIKEMSILARQFCHPIRPVTANSLMLFGFAGYGYQFSKAHLKAGKI